MPRIPCVTGGAYAVENLYELETIEAMRFRANLATQIRDLPAGRKHSYRSPSTMRDQSQGVDLRAIAPWFSRRTSADGRFCVPITGMSKRHPGGWE